VRFRLSCETCSAWYWFGMSVTGYFGLQTPAVQTRWEKDQRWDLLKASGHWSKTGTVGAIRSLGPLTMHARTAEYDPVLRAHCRLDLK
jgi:hypothetical protein